MAVVLLVVLVGLLHRITTLLLVEPVVQAVVVIISTHVVGLGEVRMVLKESGSGVMAHPGTSTFLLTQMKAIQVQSIFMMGTCMLSQTFPGHINQEDTSAKMEPKRSLPQ